MHNLGIVIRILIVAFFAGAPAVILLSFLAHDGRGILERHGWIYPIASPIIGYFLIDIYYRYNKSIDDADKHYGQGSERRWKEWWQYYWGN